jgi:beta-xylosidase
MSSKLCLSIVLLMMGCYVVDAQQVWNSDNGNETFTNPIMWGDWPDPDVIRVDDKFYFVSTSYYRTE